MNILHLTAQKPDSTGSGVYLAQTVAALAQEGHSQAVIAGIAPDDAPVLPDGVLFRPVVFDTPDLPFPVVGMSDVMPYDATRYRDLTPQMVDQFKAAFTAAYEEVLEGFEPDLIICSHLYLLCAHIAHLGVPCPMVAISHSTDIRQMRKISLERDFIAEGVRKLDRVLALHDDQAADIVEVYGVDPDRIRVVGTGFNVEEFVRMDCERSGLVFVGKLAEKKGVPSLLRALARGGQWAKGLDVRLVGGYSDQAEYDQIVALAQESPADVRLLGKVSQEDLVGAYNQAEVFVLPSFFEGLPLVIIEALACGCKVVTTDLPGVRPWLAKYVPDASVFFVQPPRMTDTDEADAGDLPRFEAELAEAIAEALAAPNRLANVSSLSWGALADRILQASDVS